MQPRKKASGPRPGAARPGTAAPKTAQAASGAGHPATRTAAAGKTAAARSRQRLRLPFEKRKSDIGEWAYDHRAGLCITVIAYLVAGILFVSAKIMVQNKVPTQYFKVELIPELIPEVKPEEQPRQQDNSRARADIRNRVSNENAQESEQETRSAQRAADRLAEELAGDQQAIEGKLRANRESYEKSLSEEQAIRNRKRDGKEDKKQQDAKVKGSVAVSFSFKNPVRTSDDLFIPAYLCRGSGTVVVNATLNRNGRVIAASVDKARSSGDQCMFDTAVDAARNSYFNVDGSAPTKHEGTITYQFQPQ
ncbi:MAG: TonB family protein [Rikenellaceae bacterium]|nr:TonB family protein [Rikenellaceae bacterium]